MLPWLPWRAAVGGVIVVGLILVTGRAYSGLSLGLAKDALGRSPRSRPYAFAMKLLATALCLGFGFVGGEVTPLFVIGATLGARLPGRSHLPARVAGGRGFCIGLRRSRQHADGVHGDGHRAVRQRLVVPAAVTCVAAYVFSTHRGIYTTNALRCRRRGTPLG